MKSKRLAKLNGKAGTVREVYGAHISDKKETKEPKPKKKSRFGNEPARPPMVYKHGELVAIRKKIHGTTNMRICGSEWGGDNHKIRRDIWCYYIKPDQYDRTSSEASPILVTEDFISGRIT